MIYALVEYINRNGKVTVKGFTSKEQADKFVANLKNRNANYLVTLL